MAGDIDKDNLHVKFLALSVNFTRYAGRPQ